MSHSKEKLLRVMQIIADSDETHPLNCTQIVTMLKDRFGIVSERKSVCRDLHLIQSCMVNRWRPSKNKYVKEPLMDIVSNPGSRDGFYVSGRNFEDWELKVMIDAVIAARFLRSDDTNSLVDRLIGLAGKTGQEILINTRVRSPNPKTRSSRVKFNIDTVLKAIGTKRKIIFLYEDVDSKGSTVLRHNGRRYIVSPYAMWRSGDYYYVRGLFEGRIPNELSREVINGRRIRPSALRKLALQDKAKNFEAVCHYRIDRMRSVECLDLSLTPSDAVANEQFGFTEGGPVSFFEFTGGYPTELVLKVNNSLLPMIKDTFGDSARIQPRSDSRFSTVIGQVMVNEGLYVWLLMQCSNISVLGPSPVRTHLLQKLRSALPLYLDSETGKLEEDVRELLTRVEQQSEEAEPEANSPSLEPSSGQECELPEEDDPANLLDEATAQEELEAQFYPEPSYCGPSLELQAENEPEAQEEEVPGR